MIIQARHASYAGEDDIVRLWDDYGHPSRDTASQQSPPSLVSVRCQRIRSEADGGNA